MKRIGDALAEIIEANDTLRFGFHNGLLNLTQTAHFLKPLVEARTHKDIQVSALVMALSRYRKSQATHTPLSGFHIDHIWVRQGLASITWPKTAEVHKAIAALFREVQQAGGFVTVSEGISEITAIGEKADFEQIEPHLQQSVAVRIAQIAGIGVKFGKRYLDQPGLLYHILQQVALQGINVAEVSSTATEFVVYVAEDQAQLAFDSIFQRFCQKNRQQSS